MSLSLRGGGQRRGRSGMIIQNAIDSGRVPIDPSPQTEQNSLDGVVNEKVLRGGFGGRGRSIDGGGSQACSRSNSFSDIQQASQQNIRGRGSLRGRCGRSGTFSGRGGVEIGSSTIEPSQTDFGGVNSGRGFLADLDGHNRTSGEGNRPPSPAFSRRSSFSDAPQPQQNLRGGGFRRGRGPNFGPPRNSGFSMRGGRQAGSTDGSICGSVSGGDRDFEQQQQRFSSRGSFGGRGGGVSSGRGGFGGQNAADVARPYSGRGGFRGATAATSTNATPLPDSFSRGGRLPHDSRSQQSTATANGFNEDRQWSRPRGRYVPRERPIAEVFAEDVNMQDLYIDVTDSDDNLAVSGVNVGTGEVARITFENWEQLELEQQLYKNIVDKAKYVRPRKIQMCVIPFILEGYDVKGHSETGSGKTAAFLIPIVEKILKSPMRSLPGAAPLAIIVEPTRELCLQVYDQCRKFADETFIRIKKVYGGIDEDFCINDLRKGCDILIATLGRLLGFLKNKILNPSEVKFFVLDEVDHVLGTHFLEDIYDIIRLPTFPPKDARQSLLFSATFPSEIQSLANEFLRRNHVMPSNNKPVAPNMRVKQEFIQVMSYREKADVLLELFTNEMKEKKENDSNAKLRPTLVFVETRRDANRLNLFLDAEGIKCATINSDCKQCVREQAIRDFDQGKVDVLVSTDVCARGIDIKGLDHVINFDMPRDNVTYVHRIGRTGRLRCGHSTSFVDTVEDKERISEIVPMLRKSDCYIPEFMSANGNMRSDEDNW